MTKMRCKLSLRITGLLLCLLLIGLFPVRAFADLYVTILAVNGTDEEKQKEVSQPLPKEVTAEDVIDTAGLQLDYDVSEGNYYVHGEVTLKPKETRKFRIRVRDLWQVNQTEIDEIKLQIDQSLSRVEGTEYYDTGLIRKNSLVQRLDFMVDQQAEFADNVGKRVDRYRAYEQELKEIRDDSLSVNYWRSKPPSPDEAEIYTFIIEVENPSDTLPKNVEPKYYLPKEVKPEHLVDTKDFEVKYDAIRKQAYLTKQEELKPAEKKKYQVSIVDIWNIKSESIEDLKERTRKSFKLLENTEYFNSAENLVRRIKTNLDKIEETQVAAEDIKQHISTYRDNTERFAAAEHDVEVLEDFLKAVRENLERSIVRNVLEKIKSLKDIKNIAEAIFGTKPSKDTTWKIITWIMIVVGVLTVVHFALWGKRSKDVVIEEEEEDKTNTEEKPKE